MICVGASDCIRTGLPLKFRLYSSSSWGEAWRWTGRYDTIKLNNLNLTNAFQYSIPAHLILSKEIGDKGDVGFEKTANYGFDVRAYPSRYSGTTIYLICTRVVKLYIYRVFKTPIRMDAKDIFATSVARDVQLYLELYKERPRYEAKNGIRTALQKN